MQRPTIPDKDIQNTDPETLVYCFTPWLIKIASRYRDALTRTAAVDMDDLLQVGQLAILKAQKKYDPNAGANFLTYSYKWIRSAMRRALGFDDQTDALSVSVISLDKPLSDDTETTLKDIIADPDALPLDAPIIDDENRQETSKQIKAALERMQSDKQREIISLVWIEGKSRKAAAEKMGIKLSAFYTLEQSARAKLRRDWRLKRFVKNEIPLFHVSVKEFNTTLTSAVEKAVLWREKHIHGNLQDDAGTEEKTASF